MGWGLSTFMFTSNTLSGGAKREGCRHICVCIFSLPYLNQGSISREYLLDVFGWTDNLSLPHTGVDKTKHFKYVYLLCLT